MEKDKLEKYITDHRNQFDDLEVPRGLWDKIDKDLNQTKSFSFFKSSLWKVAAVILLFMSSYFFFQLINSGKSYTAQMAYSGEKMVFFQKRATTTINEIKPEYTYTAVIASTNTNTNKQNTASVSSKEDSLNSELNQLKAYYASRIEQRKNEIFIFTAGNPKIEKDISIEMNELDSAYKALRIDLKDNIDNSEVVSAMIQNYRIRLEILENILEQLKKADSHEKTTKQYEI